MNTPSPRVAIIGAGLSGLYAAWQLDQHGIHDYRVFEAQHVMGGRIASAVPSLAGTGAQHRLDLGPTWFWPEHQREMAQLMQTLGLECFAQHVTGDSLLERATDKSPLRTAGIRDSLTAMRVAGGMETLIERLRRDIPADKILTGQIVRHLERLPDGIALSAEDDSGQRMSCEVEQVLLAIPPRQALQHIQFTPALPSALTAQWQQTATWMAPHAKYLAVYDRPFWREAGLSGVARSARGPMVEIHDASPMEGLGALFGFVGVPADHRRQITPDVLRQHCRAQLARLFGAEAAHPRQEYLKDWATSPFIASPADLEDVASHVSVPLLEANEGPWQQRLFGIASEWSPRFPGHLAGALDAATRGVERMLSAR
ncbi:MULTISPECIES: FAD-dependent oxidoreductase [unclassified Cobetia]|uniref:flavin monoamine oxidase family protein n=1 Tax=unclassified Cobetia TaxID=2609414 RepID=UPI002096B1AE|nr:MULTISPECIES: FAD-dependent oxidoreductase [unclassified Cobetia]MCO7231732.1 FAD-dependent oxidoreductase [Cobetia sp. Dlab-2-AX]MCO7234952.1 FAD-dependent oxidoreductase [Cobetia sp. Dlab-2-U]